MRRRRFRTLYGSSLGDPGGDPLAIVANLFDVAVVFAVGLLVALALSTVGQLVPQEPDSVTPADYRRLPRYRIGSRTLRGEAVRLGTAYRLATGEVVYVPETPETVGSAEQDHAARPAQTPGEARP